MCRIPVIAVITSVAILSVLLFYFINPYQTPRPIPKNSSPQRDKQAKSFNSLRKSPLVSEDGEDTCFCQLQGSIDDCSCNIDTVDKFNNYKIYPRLKSLLEKDYFRYFQTNLKRECPFWIDDGQCVLENCQVKECREDEVPSGLFDHDYTSKMKDSANQNKESDDPISCDEDLGYLNTSISEQSQQGFEKWKAYDNSLVDFCSVRDDEIDPDCQFVDLLLNPERFTGYNGPSAHRVWGSIYNENCFKQSSDALGPFGSTTPDDCIEKRTFYRAISGLHASINIHLSAKYFLAGSKNTFLSPKDEKLWGPNITEFRSHFDSTLTNGQSPAWLKNLYFLYLLELKAVWKLGPYLRSFELYTGNDVEDADVKLAVQDLLGTIDSFPSHFEEKALFSRKDAMKLKADFHERFTNITRIMDCVGCQKCKLWGKLQIKGLGTALRILFTEPFALKDIAKAFSRNEIVALINGFGKLSESIYELDNLRQLTKRAGIDPKGFQFRR